MAVREARDGEESGTAILMMLMIWMALWSRLTVALRGGPVVMTSVGDGASGAKLVDSDCVAVAVAV